MRYLAALCLLPLSTLAAGRDMPTGALPTVGAQIATAIAAHGTGLQRCVVSHRLDSVGNTPTTNLLPAEKPTEYYELRKGDCPAQEKQAASVLPVGR